MGKTKTAIIGNEEENLSTEKHGKNAEKHKKASQKKEDKIHISGLKGGQKVKVVEADILTETQSENEVKNESKKTKAEKIRSKKYKDAKSKIDKSKTYSVKDGVKLIKEASYSKFGGTMELHLTVKKVGTGVQVTLPHAAGKEKKVEIASDDTIKKLQEGKIDFDVLLTTADMMPKLVPFARLLGPKGLMPNPKNGTLINDPKKIKNFSTATITLKTEREAPLVHTVVGKVAQSDSEIAENIEAIYKALGGSRQILKVYLTSTMSPSVRLQVN